MADNTVDLQIKVNTETGQIDVLGKSLDQLKQSAEKTQSSFAGLSQGSKELMGALGIAATAGGIIAFFKGAVTEAESFNESMRKVKFALEANGVSWKTSGDAVAQWAQTLQQTTRFSDTDALTTLGKLTRATGSLEQAQQASKIAMGLSVASGKDLNETTGLMAQLMVGNERAIKQVRTEFGSFIGNARTAQEVVTALNSHFAQTAQSEESFTKSTAELKNQFGDLQKEVGQAMLPFLLSFTKFVKDGIITFQEFALALAAGGAEIVTVLGSMGKAFNAALHLDGTGVMNELKNLKAEISAMDEESVKEFQALEARKTDVVVAENRKRVELTTRETPEAAAERAKKDQETLQKSEERIRKTIEDKQKEGLQIQQIELQLANQIDSIGEQTFAKKKAKLDREIAAQRIKIQQEIKDEVLKQKALDQLKEYEAKQNVALAEFEVKLKMQVAMDIVDTSLQALSIINDMDHKHGAAQVSRARAILALEKAIAIARAIAAAQSAGPFAAGVAAANIALIGAQFAQQYQALGQAASGFNEADSQFRVTTDLGNGRQLEQLFGNDGPKQPFVGANPNSLAPSTGGAPVLLEQGVSGGSPAFAGATGGGGGGGGSGAPVTVNMTITLNLSPNTLDISDIRAVMRRLADELRAQASPEAIQFALAASNAAAKNAALAS